MFIPNARDDEQAGLHTEPPEDEAPTVSNVWLCRLFGHRYHPEAAEYYSIYDCRRCGCQEYENIGWLPRMAWKFELWKQDTVKGIKTWWGPCSDCGGRFGRHDDSKDHIPF